MQQAAAVIPPRSSRVAAPPAQAPRRPPLGGLPPAGIAGAFLVPEATMAQRISRAKQRIRATGASFAPPRRDCGPSGWPPSSTSST